MHDKDFHFMKLALGQAKLALQSNWIPVGAVFVKDDRVVTYGVKNGLAHVLFDHAEHNGCYQALWSRQGPSNLQGFTVFSTLEPCLMCLSMLMTTRVSRIVYAFPDPYGGGCSILQQPQLLPYRFQKEHPEVRGGVLADESKALLRKFFLRLQQKNVKSKNWSDSENPLVKLAIAD